MTKKVAISSDLSAVEKYMKELNDVNTSDIMSSKLSQSKFRPSWSITHQIPSSMIEEGEDIISAPHHLSWIMFVGSSKSYYIYQHQVDQLEIFIKKRYF